MNKAVIIFAYHFPPENTVGALRPYRFFKYLPEFGYTPIVITASPQPNPVPNVIYVGDHFMKPTRRDLEWHAERAIRKLLLPGESGITWSFRAAEAAYRHIAGTKYSHVTTLSTFPPIGCHLAALQLVAEHRIPWIADFRDPFSTDPGRQTLHNWIQRKGASTLDHVVIRRADMLIANTNVAQREWQERFPQYRDKVQLLWSGFDPELKITPAPVTEISSRPKVLRHVGSLYGGRDMLPVLEVIERMHREIAEPRFRLELIGPTDAHSTASLHASDAVRNGLQDGWITLSLSQISRPLALEAMRTAFGLVLIQQHSMSQVPAKLYEYILMQRPILAYLLRGSATEFILKNSGVRHVAIYPDDSEAGIAAKIEQFLELTPAPMPPLTWFSENFDGQRHAAALAGMLDKVVGIARTSEAAYAGPKPDVLHLRQS